MYLSRKLQKKLILAAIFDFIIYIEIAFWIAAILNFSVFMSNFQQCQHVSSEKSTIFFIFLKVGFGGAWGVRGVGSRYMPEYYHFAGFSCGLFQNGRQFSEEGPRQILSLTSNEVTKTIKPWSPFHSHRSYIFYRTKQ